VIDEGQRCRVRLLRLFGVEVCGEVGGQDVGRKDRHTKELTGVGAGSVRQPHSDAS
jgi:hypothetical protein